MEFGRDRKSVADEPALPNAKPQRAEGGARRDRTMARAAITRACRRTHDVSVIFRGSPARRQAVSFAAGPSRSKARRTRAILDVLACLLPYAVTLNLDNDETLAIAAALNRALSPSVAF